MKDEQKRQFMREAIRLSIEGQQDNSGPFGAVIVKDGQIIAKASNSVTKSNDPTAHAEINAIRMAAKVLNTFDLSGCEIYSSCEPCPMCLGAIYWSHINQIYYGNTREDAKNAGFDDDFIYAEISKPIPERKIKTSPLLSDEAIESFKIWKENLNKTVY